MPIREKYEEFINDYFEIRKRAEGLAKIEAKERDLWNWNRGSIGDFDINDNGTVEVEFYTPSGCGCCPGDTYYMTFTEDDLFAY